MSTVSHLLPICVIIVVIHTVLSMPRPRRQSFFRCSGWGAGCTNMDYESQAAATESYNPSQNQQEKEDDGVYGPPFLFTSGSSWGAIGKRSWGSISWHQDPYIRRMLLPYVLSANHQHRKWVQDYFPEEYKAIQSQLRRRSSLQVAH